MVYYRRFLRFVDNHPDLKAPFKLCAVCLKGGRVMSVGYNRPKTDPFIAGLTKSARIDKMYPSSKTSWMSCNIHAETSAIKKLKSDVDTIVVIRRDLNGNLAMAKPCNVCMVAIRQTSIKKVYYSNSEGGISCLLV